MVLQRFLFINVSRIGVKTSLTAQVLCVSEDSYQNHFVSGCYLLQGVNPVNHAVVTIVNFNFLHSKLRPIGPWRAAYSARILASRITPAHFRCSLLMNAENCSGVLSTGSAPSAIPQDIQLLIAMRDPFPLILRSH